MIRGQQIFVLNLIAIIFLIIILTKCHSYPLFNELSLPIPERSTKFYSQNDVDRYVNRMKQYYQTMAHLRYWRRSLDDYDSNEDYYDLLQSKKH